MKHIITVLLIVFANITAVCAAEDESTLSSGATAALPEASVVGSAATELGDPLKKQMKQWKKIDTEDMTALSTEQALALRDYLGKKGKKQIKRGRILFWTGLVWPLVGGIVGGASGANVVAGVCAGLGVGQMVWGYMDMLNGRQNSDAARKVIVSVPDTPPGQYDDLQQQIKMATSRWQHDMAIGPRVCIRF